MALFTSSLSRRLSRSVLSKSKLSPKISTSLFSTNRESDYDDSDPIASSLSSSSSSSTFPEEENQRRPIFQRPLENGLDVGVYKAILVGQVGQSPVQKRLKSGRLVTLFSLGTGGIRNNRRPLDNEEPREYAERCSVQWHRVAVYPERLGGVALKHVKPGSILYLEGNLETKIFNDPITGLAKRIREIAIRRDGRLVFLSNDINNEQTTQMELKGVGYY